jgi:hypothetical protein
MLHPNAGKLIFAVLVGLSSAGVQISQDPRTWSTVWKGQAFCIRWWDNYGPVDVSLMKQLRISLEELYPLVHGTSKIGSTYPYRGMDHR